MAKKWRQRAREAVRREQQRTEHKSGGRAAEDGAVTDADLDTSICRPQIQIPLGLGAGTWVTSSEFAKRLRQRAKVVRSGRRRLDFLLDPSVLYGARMGVVDGDLCALIDVPKPPQEDWVNESAEAGETADAKPDEYPVNLPPQLRGADGGEGRSSSPVERACNEAATYLAEVALTAQLLDQVADVLSAAADPKVGIAALERRYAADTTAARHFIYQKQGPMEVLVDGAPVVFARHEVRVSAPISPVSEVLATISMEASGYGALRVHAKQVLAPTVDAWAALGAERGVPLRISELCPQELGLLLLVGSQEPVHLSGSLHRSTTGLERRHMQLDKPLGRSRGLLIQAIKLLYERLKSDDLSG